MIYRTDFRLTEDVLNEDEARAYLLSFDFKNWICGIDDRRNIIRREFRVYL